MNTQPSGQKKPTVRRNMDFVSPQPRTQVKRQVAKPVKQMPTQPKQTPISDRGSKDKHPAKSKKKTIIIVVTVLAALGIVTLVMMLPGLFPTTTHPNENNAETTESSSYSDSKKTIDQETLNNILAEGKKLSNNGQKEKAAIDFYASKVNESLDATDDKVAFQILWAVYDDYFRAKKFNEAIKILDQVDIKRFNEVSQTSLYLCYARAYDALGNTKMKEKYLELSN